jgi:hypothetical protein
MSRLEYFQRVAGADLLPERLRVLVQPDGPVAYNHKVQMNFKRRGTPADHWFESVQDVREKIGAWRMSIVFTVLARTIFPKNRPVPKSPSRSTVTFGTSSPARDFAAPLVPVSERCFAEPK